jgi:hypothetical protein
LETVSEATFEGRQAGNAGKRLQKLNREKTTN